MIHFIYGEDTFRSRGALVALRQQYIDHGATDIIQLAAPTLTSAGFQNLLQGASLFSNQRLVILEEVFSSQLRDDIVAALKAGVSEDLTIVIYENGNPDKRLVLFKLLTKVAQVHVSDFLVGSPLFDYVQKLAIQHQVELSPQLINRLVSIVGNDLWRVDRELAKLSAFAKTNSLTEVSVDQLVSSGVERDIFGVLESLGQRHFAHANQLLADLVQRGEDPIGILAIISWQLRNLIRIGDLIHQGKSATTITQITGLHPYAVANSIRQLTKFSSRWLISAYQLVTKIDWRIKQGDIEAHDAVDWLVATLAQAV